MNTRAKATDKPVVTIHMLQDLMNKLQTIEPETIDNEHDSDVTQGGDFEEEDSEGDVTEIEEQLLPKIKTIQENMQEGYDPIKYYVDVEKGPFV